MSNINWINDINWGIGAALVSAIAAATGLFFQRIDIRKQNRYQRETFELKHRIEEEAVLFDIASNIIATIKNLALTKDQLYRHTIIKRSKWSANVKGMGSRVHGATIFADMTEALYDEAKIKLKDLEDKNDTLMDNLGIQISKLKINIVHLDKSIQDNLEIEIEKLLQVLEDMDREINLVQGVEDIEKNSNEDNKNWAHQYHEIMRDDILKFQEIFSDMKRKTHDKVERIS